MFRKLFLGGWYLLVAILILFAIAITIVRGYPSIYQKYLPAIQQNISSILGKPVQVDSIRIDWYGITPQITARNLSIFEEDDQYDQLLNVDEAVISVDIYKSMVRRNITFKEITFTGGNLEAVRTLDERIILNGIDISKRLAERKKTNQSNKLKINLLNSSISIIDEIKRLDYFFDRVDVVLNFTGDRFELSSKFVLPQTLGQSFVLSADIRDLDKGFKNIKGKLYSKGENINLELVNDFFPGLHVGVRKGLSDFQLWGNFNSLTQRTFVGKLALHDLIYKDVEVPIRNAKENEEITSINADFRLQGEIEDWQLSLKEVAIKTANHEWPGKTYEISCIDCGQHNYTFAAALDYLDTDQLLSTLQHFPFMSERLNEVLERVEVQGVLQESQLLVQFNENQLTKYAYKTFLQDANISIPEQEFYVTSIVGNVSGNHHQGSLSLVCDALGLRIDKLLNQPLENHNVKGVVSWQHADGKISVAMQDIIIEANEMTAYAQGLMQIIDNKPFIDIQLEVPLATAETIKQYIPHKILKPLLSRWLTESIVAGTIKDGKLLIHGNPKNYPFKDKPGSFELSANIEEAVVDYRPDWPSANNVFADFLIKNNYLVLNASHGEILDSSIHQLQAQIDDLKLPILVIDGSATGPASNILTYLEQSSLLPKDSKLVKDISTNGDINLDLNIILTLTKKLERKKLVRGEIEFDDTSLVVNTLALPFTNLNGKLRFDKHGAEGSGLSARLYGAPMRASAIKSNGRTLLSVAGDFDLDSYLSSNYTRLKKYIKGVAPISAEINLPRFGKNSTDKSLKVSVETDLYGVSTSLPDPFQKAFDETKIITIHTTQDKGVDSTVYANLEDQVFMQAIIDKETRKLSKVELRLGDQQFNLPANGIKISGKTNKLDLAEWKELAESDYDQDIEVKEIDLFVNRVDIGNLSINDVKFRAVKNTQFWTGDINSSVAKGAFEYPTDTSSGSIATANFDYLRFASTEKKTTQAANFDPRKLPALVVNAKQFQFKDSIFSDVSLKTKPSATGLTIDSLKGNGRDLQVTANGSWESVGDNSQNTNLVIKLVSQNIQNSLTGLGFDSAVSGGDGTVAANFDWPKAPYQFSLESVTGNAKLRFNDGAIASVEPGGAGRLVGLFNLGEITRRLSLDFTDFFAEGYSFEKIRGDLNFKNANLTTENLKIKGPSADLLIQGRTGITAKDYDQIVTVTAQVSGGLPWIGLAVGGPLGAVGVLVGEKIAKSIGVDINKVTELQYSVKGSWQEPVIEPIAHKTAGGTAAPQAQGQPSPNNQPQVQPPVTTQPSQQNPSPNLSP